MHVSRREALGLFAATPFVARGTPSADSDGPTDQGLTWKQRDSDVELVSYYLPDDVEAKGELARTLVEIRNASDEELSLSVDWFLGPDLRRSPDSSTRIGLSVFESTLAPGERTSQAAHDRYHASAADIHPDWEFPVSATQSIEVRINDSAESTTLVEKPLTVTAPNPDPEADAGPERVVDAGSEVTLDGRGTTDPDGDQLAYHWIQVSGPTVSPIDGSRSATPSFTAPSVSGRTTLKFQLEVEDANDDADRDYVDVIVEPVGTAVETSTPDSRSNPDGLDLPVSARDTWTLLGVAGASSAALLYGYNRKNSGK